MKTNLSVTLYKEKRFKESPIGKIPEDWEVTELQSVISLCQNGIWGYDPVPNEVSYPVIRSTEITHDGKIDLSTVAFRKIPKEKVRQYQLQDGDILVVGSSGSSHLIGRSALFLHPKDGRIYLFSNFVIRIRPQNVNSKFLYYYLNSTSYYNFLKSLQQTSTGLRNLPKKKLLKLNIPLPPFSEQKAIAQVLSTVDETIQKTNEIIAKTERLKKGLMQELLTKGIGHKEFKDTKIGRLPKEWKIVRLEEVAEKTKNSFVDGPFGSDLKRNNFVDYGIPVIQLHNIGEGFFITNELKYITEKKYTELIRHETRPDDVIITKLGDPVAQACVVPNIFEKYMIVADCVRLRVNKEIANPYFIQYVINSKIVRLQATARAKGTTRKRINLSEIRKLLIPLPHISEQQKIVDILSTVDKKIDIERKREKRLRQIKKALMNLLLTGEIRVKVSQSANSHS